MKDTSENFIFYCVTPRRQISKKKKAGSHQPLNLLVPSLGESSALKLFVVEVTQFVACLVEQPNLRYSCHPSSLCIFCFSSYCSGQTFYLMLSKSERQSHSASDLLPPLRSMVRFLLQMLIIKLSCFLLLLSCESFSCERGFILPNSFFFQF